MIACTVCGLWCPADGGDRLDICTDCLEKNFAGASPPLDAFDPRDPSARAQLEAFVDAAHQLTPRQVEAMTRLAAAWRRREEG